MHHHRRSSYVHGKMKKKYWFSMIYIWIDAFSFVSINNGNCRQCIRGERTRMWCQKLFVQKLSYFSHPLNFIICNDNNVCLLLSIIMCLLWSHVYRTLFKIYWNNIVSLFISILRHVKQTATLLLKIFVVLF